MHPCPGPSLVVSLGPHGPQQLERAWEKSTHLLAVLQNIPTETSYEDAEVLKGYYRDH